MATSRVRRARQTEELAAAYFAAAGAIGAERVPASIPGRDIRKVPGIAPEVKASRDGNLTAALRQAVKNAGDDLALVVWRPDGYGPEKIDEWVVAFRFEDAIQLLKDAGKL